MTSLKKLDEWLVLMALNKALYNFDHEAYERYYRQYGKGQKLHVAQRGDLNMYIFGTEKGKMINIKTMQKELKDLKIWHKNVREKMVSKA